MNNYKPLKKFFEKQGWEYEESEKLHKCITVKNKGDMWLYNYNDKVLVPRDHPVIVKCRGLVLREDGSVLNYPFDRFFNSFEKECATIDWNSSVILNKEDGSLICVFWNGDNWEITTRGSFYSEEPEQNYAKWFRKLFNNFDKLRKDYCYMFEMVTKNNRIVTWYDEEEVYLIGARDLNNLQEMTQAELYMESERIVVKRPDIFFANNKTECKALFEGLKDDDEGFVIVDKDFNRMKLKQESYIKLSRIKQLKPQDLLDHILGKSNIDQEYLNKLPEVLSELDSINQKWNNIKLGIETTYRNICLLLGNKMSRKDFAEQAVKHPYKSVLFNLFDGKGIDYKLPKWEVIKGWK